MIVRPEFTGTLAVSGDLEALSTRGRLMREPRADQTRKTSTARQKLATGSMYWERYIRVGYLEASHNETSGRLTCSSPAPTINAVSS
jgi:hypothetical protein